MNTTRFAPSLFSMSQLPFIDYPCEEQSASTTRYKQGDPPLQVLWATVLDVRMSNIKLLQYHHITQFPNIYILFTTAIIFKFCFVTKSCMKHSTKD